MKAITTKYLPYTSTKPSRIKAFDCDGHSVTISYDDASKDSGDIDSRHRAAAVALCEKMKWDSTHLVGGYLRSGSFAFVWDDVGVRAKAMRDIANTLAKHPDVRRPESLVKYAYEIASANCPKV